MKKIYLTCCSIVLLAGIVIGTVMRSNECDYAFTENVEALSYSSRDIGPGWATCAYKEDIIPSTFHAVYDCDGCNPVYGFFQDAFKVDRCYHD